MARGGFLREKAREARERWRTPVRRATPAEQLTVREELRKAKAQAKHNGHPWSDLFLDEEDPWTLMHEWALPDDLCCAWDEADLFEVPISYKGIPLTFDKNVPTNATWTWTTAGTTAVTMNTYYTYTNT